MPEEEMSTLDVALRLLDRIETYGALVVVACAIVLMLAAIVAVRSLWSDR